MLQKIAVMFFLVIGNCMGQLETIINSIEDKHLKDMRLILIDETMLNGLIERKSVLVIKRKKEGVFHSELKLEDLLKDSEFLRNYIYKEWVPDSKLKKLGKFFFGTDPGIYIVFKIDKIQRWLVDGFEADKGGLRTGDCIFFTEDS